MHHPSSNPSTSCLFYINDQNTCSLGNPFYTGGSMSGSSSLNVMVNYRNRKDSNEDIDLE